jgi:hypothetical protein
VQKLIKVRFVVKNTNIKIVNKAKIAGLYDFYKTAILAMSFLLF